MTAIQQISWFDNSENGRGYWYLCMSASSITVHISLHFLSWTSAYKSSCIITDFISFNLTKHTASNWSTIWVILSKYISLWFSECIANAFQKKCLKPKHYGFLNVFTSSSLIPTPSKSGILTTWTAIPILGWAEQQ